MSQRLCKLLGRELSYLASGEKLATSELDKAGNTIGLLFAADDALNTEQTARELGDLRDSLIQLHGELKKRSDVAFEVVLIPMNQTQCPEDSTTGIKQLFSQKDCPFLSISHEKTQRIQEFLCRKYEVKEMPSLILIEAHTTEVIIFNAKEKLLKDKKGAEFPWKYPPFSKILESGPLLRNKLLAKNAGECTTNGADSSRQYFAKEAITSNDVGHVIKGLLFAAFWCPPCRTFLAALVDLYKSVNKEKKRLEIIFVSSDRSQESFCRFFSTMPWVAVPFEDEKRRELLTSAFNVKAIPNLTLLDVDDSIITTEGRLEVNDDLEGIEFPWHPRLVDELRERHSSTLNNSLCVIYFTDDSDTDYDTAETILNPVATEFDLSSLEEAYTPKFFVAADSDLAESLRIFMDLEETRSYLVIVDVANSRYAIQANTDNPKLSESSVKDFLSKFQTNKLPYKYMQSRFI